MHYKKLNLPVELIPYDYGVVDLPDRFVEIKMELDHINKEVHDFLDSIDVEIVMPRYFHSGPPHVYNLHVDVPTRPNQYTRLNWIFGGDGSQMIWYKLQPGKTPAMVKNSLGEDLPTFNVDDCIEIERAHIIGPNLVNVGTIHNLMGGIQERHCYSFFLRDKKNKNDRMEWNQAIGRFRPFLGDA
jgi:hypothetical protein